MKPKAPTGFTRCLLTTAAAVIGLVPVAFAQAPQTFFVLNNPNDTMFNQLLGINNGNVIVGYLGDGNLVHNNGYVLVPTNHYSIENFTNVAGCTAPPEMLFPPLPCPTQTQAIGINNATGLAGQTPFPDIVGFYTDAVGATHGFVDSFSAPATDGGPAVGVQSTIDDPMGVKGVNGIQTTVQNLLGINNSLRAVGFWTDAAGNENGFLAEINTTVTPVAARYIEFPPAKVNNDLALTGNNAAIATQTSGINNNNTVCGFYTDRNGINHGFEVVFNTRNHTFNRTLPLIPNANQIPNVKSLSPLGCNDPGRVVGFFTANDNTVHGFVFDGADWHQYDAAGSVQTPALGNVMGTTINGVNNAGAIVGFFADAMGNVNGFVDFAPVP